MLHLVDISKRFTAFTAALVLLLGLSIPVLLPLSADALLLSERSLTLSSSAPGTEAVGAEGTGGNGAKAKHTIGFDIATSGNVGSILIQYCTSPVFAVSCTTPTDFDADTILEDSATLVTQNFNAAEDFEIDQATANPTGCNGGGSVRENCVLMNRATARAETATTAVTIAYGGSATEYITNPSPVNYSFYARITTYSDTAYTTAVDTGSVAAATAQQISITARVAERLEFSVGTTPTDPQAEACTPFNDAGTLTLGDGNGVLATDTAYDAHSYFRVNSNTVFGTKVFYSGDTLTSGSNSINAIGTTAVDSDIGTEQFGLALDTSDTDPVPGGVAEGHSFTDLTEDDGTGPAAHTTDYSSGAGTITDPGTALFAYDTGSITAPVEIAYVTTGGVTCDTGSVRYIANIATNTPAGIYTTTITYIATGTY